MKPEGRHPEKKLTAVRVRNENVPGRYADGNGLYLVVESSGAKRWLLRIVVHGRRRDIGLGGVSIVSLAEAREKAAEFRKIARSGGDPVAVRDASRRVVPTFREAAEQVHAEHLPSWKNKKHGDQWINTIRTYVLPILGDKRVDQIATPDVLRVLAPIWLSKAETARRIRQRIGTVMDWAKTAGFRSGDNPVDGVEKGLPKQGSADGHHAAMDYAEVPAFITAIRASDAGLLTKLAFEFLILTATRTSEVLGAKWSEIDFVSATWMIPAERMKAKRGHRVPLSARCLEVLAVTRPLAEESEFVFPGKSDEKPLSNMVFLMLLRRLKSDVTAHGFRSSFRIWAAEQTHYPREVCEMALAHALEDKTEAAYQRSDLFEQRKELMQAWADYACRSEKVDQSENSDPS